MNINEIAVKNIKKQLEIKGWTVKQLSEHSGISINRLNRILSGKTKKIKATVIVAIVQAFKVRAFDILEI